MIPEHTYERAVGRNAPLCALCREPEGSPVHTRPDRTGNRTGSVDTHTDTPGEDTDHAE